MRLHASIVPAALLALVALAFGACGDDEGTIPRDQAETLLQTLGEIERKVQEGDCSSAQTDATQFVAQVDLLPRDVGVEAKQVLREAGENLIALTQDPDQCAEPEVEPPPESGATGAVGPEEDG